MSTSATNATVPSSEIVTGGAFGKKGIGWAVFEWARNPYFNLIVIFIFSVYFAQTVVGDPVRGQEMVSWVILVAGLIMAPLAPVLGAIVDNAGRKKPFLFGVLTLLASCAAGLWFITPDLPGAIPIGMALLVTGYCCYTVSELLHNSMLPGAGAPKSIPAISGLGLALGNAAGALLLVIILVMIFTGAFGLSGETMSRLTGPVVAIWLIVFSAFFFWLMPDVYREGETWGGAFKTLGKLSERERQASGGFWPLGFFIIKPVMSVVTKFRQFPDVMKYLLARMIWADALQLLYAIGAVYVAGVLGWSEMEVILYAIFASVFAAMGGFLGGALDQRLGPKLALSVELTSIMILLILQLSITQDSLLYGLIPVEGNLNDWPVFNTLADIAYLGLIIPGTILLVACITSSRYMLVHISPPENIGEFFGFYAMVGSATIWIGPGLVAIVTRMTGSQRWGLASVLLLFALGLAILQFVEADKTPTHLKIKDADLLKETGA